MLDYLGAIDLPEKVIILVIAIIIVSQIIGEIGDAMDKVMPEILTLRKCYVNRRKRRESIDSILADVQELKKTNETLVEAIVELKDISNRHANDILDMRLDDMRTKYLEFTTSVASGTRLHSREQFAKMERLYERYEELITEHGLTNGEIDISHRIVTDIWQRNLKENNFLEDSLGYENK